MLFNSVIFLYAFLPITYAVFWILRSKQSRYLWLSVTGYIFYGWWNPKFCLLMLFSTVVAFFSALAIERASTKKAKRVYLLISIIVDLALLGFFKYYGFAAHNLNDLFQSLHWNAALPVLQIILPVGISFYTFHTLSYVIDTYRGSIRPTSNFFEFSCYVSLFSQLVAGPIVRFRQIEQDLENIDHSLKTSRMERGVSYLILGMCKKVLIADSLATFVNPAFQNIEGLSTVSAWLSILGYSYQLYFDFSGYSDMAIGLGELFGIRIPINFNSPYRATDPSDFWRRWHISLSTWLRDYLYISLGGNRSGELRTLLNLLLTMLLGGLWHGAEWTFVYWGAFHGLLLVFHRLYRRAVSKSWELPDGLARALMFLAAMMGWVLFRAENLSSAKKLFQRMFTFVGSTQQPFHPAFLLFVCMAGAIAHFVPNTHEFSHRYRSPAAIGLVALFILCLMRVLSDANSPFLYFQF